MNHTLIIATIGCVTGVLGLLLQLRAHLLTSARLRIEVCTPSPQSYFFRHSDFGVSGFRSKYGAVVSLKISNCSSHPITIDGAFIPQKENAHPILHFPGFELNPKNMPIGKGLTTHYAPSEPLKIPYRLEAFDTIFASVRFPFFESKVPEKLRRPARVRVCLSTPRRVYTCRAKIYEYAVLHQIRHGHQQ